MDFMLDSFVVTPCRFQRRLVLALAVINVDKIYAGGVNPDEHFSRLGHRVGQCT
jgi:hypothetical protein